MYFACTAYSEDSEEGSFDHGIKTSSSAGSDHTDQPSLLTWPPTTLSPVHHCSFLGALLIDTDHCRLGTSHESCSFEDALTQTSRRHNLVLVKPLRLPIFPASNVNFEDKMFAC
ncbi:hypothetical protein HF521_001167 [Silurus meridionalis]|uniref:Uncharacterized protein n=1 Tax=Silurus meridionalis TaxID=175797 RepID=A0A8T0BA12_SILME|nr:hypothetical protein HF521_001167 [Silurus meridionalis]